MDIDISVLTPSGVLGYKTAFGAGLNVLRAPNSFGKSTLLQSTIFALGLEGMITQSRTSPLGPAMTTVVDLPDGRREQVVESSVTLTCRNGSGRVLRTRRYARSSDIDLRLIQTWAASSVDGLRDAKRIDTFVRMPGSAVRELGFHSVLAEFIGWELPLVPAYRGGDVPLYLETLFPLFYVEQKNGWGGVTPRMPTYLGIRDMLRRSVEFVLGLSTLDRVRAANALREELAKIRLDWTSATSAIEAAARAEGMRAITPSQTPVARSGLFQCVVETYIDDEWTPLRTAEARWSARLEELRATQVQTVGDRAEESAAELEDAERRVATLGAQAQAYAEQGLLVRADLDALAGRLASVEADRQRLLDLQRLRTLGSDLGVSPLSDDLCPRCLQAIDDRHSLTGHAASLEETLSLGDAERLTLTDMQGAASRRAADIERVRAAIGAELNETRRRVRLLRDELLSRSATPSLVEVQEQLSLRDRLLSAERVAAAASLADDTLATLATRFDDVRNRLAALESQDMNAEDRSILERFQTRFSAQLNRYGLSSLPPNQVSIDPESLIPTDDGVELRFDISVGMSASDTIRTKWAYYVALLEASAGSSRGHHARFLVFDEPRQQETAKVSMAQLIKELGVASTQENQVIYATSEEPSAVEEYLSDVPHTRLEASGSRLLSPRADNDL